MRTVRWGKKKIHSINIRNENEVIATGLIDDKRIIKGYYEKFYAYKFNNLMK